MQLSCSMKYFVTCQTFLMSELHQKYFSPKYFISDQVVREKEKGDWKLYIETILVDNPRVPCCSHGCTAVAVCLSVQVLINPMDPVHPLPLIKPMSPQRARSVRASTPLILAILALPNWGTSQTLGNSYNSSILYDYIAPKYERLNINVPQGLPVVDSPVS